MILARPRRLWPALALVLSLGSPAVAGAAPFTPGPATHALVVVDASIRQKSLGGWYALRLRSGTLADSGATSRDDDPAPARATAESVADALPFVIVPGAYRPATLVAEGNVARAVSGFTVVLPDSVRGLVTEAAAGAVVYVGRIEVQSIPRMLKQNEYRFSISREPGRELEVMERLLKRARRTAWAPAIEARIAALGGAAAIPGSRAR